MNVEFITYPVQDWILDEETGQLKPPEISIQSIAQVVKFSLSTERNMYPAIGHNFGIELEDLIGQDRAYVTAQLKKRITEAVMVDDRITGIGSFSFSSQRGSDSLSVDFVVETVLGKVNMTTEIIV